MQQLPMICNSAWAYGDATQMHSIINYNMLLDRYMMIFQPVEERQPLVASLYRGKCLQSIAVCHAEMCIQARRLGLLGEAVAAEQILSQRQVQASQHLKYAAAHGSAAEYSTAMAAAQAAAVPAAVISQAEAAFAARCTDAAAKLVAAATHGSWAAFDASRRKAAQLEQVVTEAKAQMQSRRNAASTAVSAALKTLLDGLNLDNLSASGTVSQQHGRAQSSMHCTGCSSSFESQQAQSAPSSAPACHASYTAGSPHHVWITSAQQTSLDMLNEQVTCLMSQMIDALPGSDKNDAVWQHALLALAELLDANQRQNIPAIQRSALSKPSQNSAEFTAALSSARHVGLTQTVQLALQVLHKHIEMAQQAQQAVIKFESPAAQHVQDCTLAWEQQPVSTASSVLPVPSSVGHLKSLGTAASLREQRQLHPVAGPHSSASGALPQSSKGPLIGPCLRGTNADKSGVGMEELAAQQLAQDLSQGAARNILVSCDHTGLTVIVCGGMPTVNTPCHADKPKPVCAFAASHGQRFCNAPP